MDPVIHIVLLHLAAISLGTSAVAGAIGLRLHSQRRRLSNRLALMTGRRDTASGEVWRNRRPAVTPTLPWLQLAGRVIGYSAKRSDQYKVKWWLVVPTCLMLAWFGLGLVISLLGGVARAPVLVAAAPAAALMLSRSFYKVRDERRQQALILQFPDALAMIVQNAQIGIALDKSISVVARESPEPTAREFCLVADRIRLGGTLEDALHELAERNNVAEYRFFATAMSLYAQTGVALSDTLENLAVVIDRRFTLRARGCALISEARASIIILCALPVVTAVALVVINADYMAPLFSSPTGQAVFGCAVLSLCLGWFTMHHIVKRTFW